MKRAKRTLSLLLVTAMVLAVPSSGLWATSAVPEPGAFGIPINPNASGTKVSGPLSVAYDFVPDQIDPNTGRFIHCTGGLIVNDMFIVARFQKGSSSRTFYRNFSKAAPPATPLCFDDQNAQVSYILAMGDDDVIPQFFNCTARVSCPFFQVKSVTNFLSSGTGAVSMDIDLAVK